MDQSEEMFNLVRQWRKSGLSQSEFCKPHGITAAKFGYWVGKEKLVKKGAGFVHIPAQRSATDNAYEVIYPNGVKVNYQGCDLTVLSELIRLY
jgi:hypothetical protein